MPVIDISNANSKLIGICCLQGNERELVKSLWTKRFSGHTAFFTEASAEDSALKITKRIYKEVEACGFHSMPGLSVIVAVFLDLREDVSESLLQALAGVPNRLSGALGCDVQMKLNFGFVGSLSEVDAQALRQKIKAVAQSDLDSRGLYLVAEPDFGGKVETRWKAAMVYLDLLRRGASAQQIMFTDHPNGTVGFLRYGEYDENMLSKLQKERDELSANLSNNGSMQFSQQLTSLLTTMEMAAAGQFQVNAAMQPIHPDMTVNGWLNRQRASHGNYAPFNLARASTLQAVCDTGDRIVEQIGEAYQAQMGDAKTCLVELFQKANAGIGFVKDRSKVQSYLEQKMPVVQDPPMPILAYNENGYTDEISRYLAEKLAYGQYKAKKTALESLLNAYNAMDDVQFIKTDKQMKDRLEIVKINLNHLPSKQNFCSLALGTGMGLESDFSAILGAPGDVTIKHLVCRKTADQSFIQNVVPGSNHCYFIDEVYGGLGELDDAPIKAVQAALFDCTDERLEDLLDEE